MVVDSERGLEELRKQFRHFLLAELPDGRMVMFRFYDPRVMRPYLPTCNRDELGLWFSNVNAFVMESEDGRSVTYSFDGQSLQVR